MFVIFILRNYHSGFRSEIMRAGLVIAGGIFYDTTGLVCFIYLQTCNSDLISSSNMEDFNTFSDYFPFAVFHGYG